MIGNAQIQEDLVTLLKAELSVTSLLASSAEVREASFMGGDFSYPTLRIKVENNSPFDNADPCDHASVVFSILCYSEEASSKSCQDLAAAVNNFLHRRFITGTGYKIPRLRSSGLGGPGPIDQNTWMVRCGFVGNVRPT
ncbi:hypothetical protein LCGC14_1274950 [marine sediment metagenome]|uniref:Uncharacterized protein n=1 Tax=marine sediment metagenome TaxID=412755 RepID=A0A0F9NDP5_9ZZZZ|nr:DUF3168 domain-containing protein [Candidatus Aminicenantes bacterium]